MAEVSVSKMILLVLIGIIMMVFAYYLSIIGIGFQLLIGGIGAVFIVIGILGLFGIVLSTE